MHPPIEPAEIPRPALQTASEAERIEAFLDITIDPTRSEVQIIPDRETSKHIWGTFLPMGISPDFVDVEILNNDYLHGAMTLEITITNPLQKPVYDPRLIVYPDAYLTVSGYDAFTDYHAEGEISINPFYAYATDKPKRKLSPGDSGSRVVEMKYSMQDSLINLKMCIDACIGGNTEEPYDIANIIQRGRGIYCDILDWQDDPSLVRVTRADGKEWGVTLNRINNEKTFASTIYFPNDPAYKLLISASGSDGHGIYKYFDWDPSLMPIKYGQGVYAWTFYNPDTSVIAPSYQAIINQCTNKFGCSWLLPNMGQVCYDGTIIYDDAFFHFVQELKTYDPDFPVILNIGRLGFRDGDIDHCGLQFDHDFRRFFSAFEKELVSVHKKFEMVKYIDGYSFDFEMQLAPEPMWYRQEFLDAYGDFVASLRRRPGFDKLYLVTYNDELMPKELNYEYDYLNHCKQADFFLTAAFPTSYVWNQDWWVEPEQTSEYFNAPTATEFLKEKLAIYSQLADTVSTPFYPVIDMQGVWMDYHGDTLPAIQPCDWKYLANISDWCFGYPGSFGTSDETLIARGRWLHKKEVERVIADIPSVDVDVLSLMGAVFYVLGDRYPDITGDDVIWSRSPYSYYQFSDVIRSFDSPYIKDPVIFHWEVAQKYKAYGFNDTSPTGLGAVSGRISFEDSSSFTEHLSDYRQAYVEVTGLPDGLPDFFYRTYIIGIDDGSYAFAGIPAVLGLTFQVHAGSFISDPVIIDVKKGVHTRGVDFVLHTE